MRQTHLSAWVTTPPAAEGSNRDAGKKRANSSTQQDPAQAKNVKSQQQPDQSAPAAGTRISGQPGPSGAMQQDAPSVASVSALPLESYLSTVSALTRGNPDGIVREVSNVEEAYYKLGSLKQVLAINGMAGDGQKNKRELLNKLTGRCLFDPTTPCKPDQATAAAGAAAVADGAGGVPIRAADLAALGWACITEHNAELLDRALAPSAALCFARPAGPGVQGGAAEATGARAAAAAAPGALATAAAAGHAAPTAVAATSAAEPAPSALMPTAASVMAGRLMGGLPAAQAAARTAAATAAPAASAAAAPSFVFSGGVQHQPWVSTSAPPSAVPIPSCESVDEVDPSFMEAQSPLKPMLAPRHGAATAEEAAPAPRFPAAGPATLAPNAPAVYQTPPRPRQQPQQQQQQQQLQQLAPTSAGAAAAQRGIGSAAAGSPEVAWVAEQIRSFASTTGRDTEVSGDGVAGGPTTSGGSSTTAARHGLIGRRVAFLLVQEMRHTHKGVEEVIPVGLHMGRVVQSQGSACHPDACEQCGGPHAFFFVKVLEEQVKLDLLLDLHDSHRMASYEHLLQACRSRAPVAGADGPGQVAAAAPAAAAAAVPTSSAPNLQLLPHAAWMLLAPRPQQEASPAAAARSPAQQKASAKPSKTQQQQQQQQQRYGALPLKRSMC